jgi:hypothetical protein
MQQLNEPLATAGISYQEASHGLTGLTCRINPPSHFMRVSTGMW